jgi:hypothetical protein
MNPEMATVIDVRREVRDSWFIYTSDQLPGLYLASPDDRKAYEDLPAAIRELILLESGVECRVMPRVEYREFQKMLQLANHGTGAAGERTDDRPASRDLSFVVECVRPENAHA